MEDPLFFKKTLVSNGAHCAPPSHERQEKNKSFSCAHSISFCLARWMCSELLKVITKVMAGGSSEDILLFLVCSCDQGLHGPKSIKNKDLNPKCGCNVSRINFHLIAVTLDPSFTCSQGWNFQRLLAIPERP